MIRRILTQLARYNRPPPNKYRHTGYYVAGMIGGHILGIIFSISVFEGSLPLWWLGFPIVVLFIELFLHYHERSIIEYAIPNFGTE